MSVAENVRQSRAPGRPTAGIDWASAEHAVSVVGPDGVELERFAVCHTAAGLQRLLSRLRQAGVAEVGNERPDGPIVDALLGAGLSVFVVAPSQLRSLRGRYGSAGNKDDSFDAFVLAGLFRDIDSRISLRFLTRYPTQDKADWLSAARLENWLRAAGYSHPRRAAALHVYLAAATRGTTGAQANTRAAVTLALVAGLTALREQIHVLDEHIAAQLAAHPDAAIFTSLPRSGTVRAARLLAEIGDARGRFPTPEALTCLAGAAPSTRQSGKVKVVNFRWAVDKQLRGAVIDYAGDSHHANPRAADLYQRARARGHDHPHAVRILARAWLHVTWRCRQNHAPYDPTQHRALQTVLNHTA